MNGQQVSLEQALNMAMEAQRTGKSAQAERIYRQVIAQLPTNYPNHHSLQVNLGVAVASQGRADEALPFFRRAIELQPNYAAAHANLGFALKSNRRYAEARESFQTALKLRADDPNTLLNLGILHAEQGDVAAATKYLRDALRHNPLMADAWLRLVTIQNGDVSDEDYDAIDNLQSRSDLSGEKQACIHAALARIHDVRGEYEQAASHADQANADQQSHLQQSARQYNPDAHGKYVDRLVATFNAGLLDRYRDSGSDSRMPVFIFGTPRSGTTLVEQILTSHPEVCGAGELSYVFDSFRSIPVVTGIQQSPMDCVPSLTHDDIEKIATQHLNRLQHLDAGASRVINKLPDNYLLLGLIRMLFPNATLIHCRRDLRDVAVSCWITHFHNVPWTHDRTHIATRINAYQYVMRHWNDLLPSQVTSLNYEQLVSDPEAMSRRLVAWCGLEWDPACLAFHRSRRVVQTASETQIRQAISTKSVGRFRNYEHYLADLFEAIE